MNLVLAVCLAALASNIRYRPDADDAYARERCLLDVRTPDGAKGFATVVWFHWGGLDSGEKHFVPIDEKIAQVAANYRLLGRHGLKDGEECVWDAAAAVAWTLKHIAEYGGDPKKVYVSGMSAGGYLTLMVGMAPKYLGAFGYKPTDLAGIVPLSGQASKHFNVRKYAGDDKAEPFLRIDELAPLHWAGRDLPPIVDVCGEPPWEWECRSEENRLLVAICTARGHKNAKFVQIPFADHGRTLTAGGPYVELMVNNRLPKNLSK